MECATNCCGQVENQLAPTAGASSVQYYQPDVDVYENEAEVVLMVDVPGASPESISVEHENGKLNIRASVAERSTEGKMLLQEYGVADFLRSFQLGEGLNADEAKAEYTDGVLQLRIPKNKSGNSKKIAISNH